MTAIVQEFEHSFALPFFGIGMKTDLFQSWGHCWVFQISWHIECSTFTASSFRIWNSSTGITSPSLALFLVMLPKAHLTSHSRIPGPRWVITPSWLSGSWRSYLHHSSVYSCHLFLISSISVRSIPFLFFTEPIFVWNIALVSLIFLKRSLVFPILLLPENVSNYCTIALISHTSKVMLKILQARLQQYMNQELPDVQIGFRKGRGTRDQIANIC